VTSWRGPIRIFTPSYADEANTNAQNLTVKEVVARLPEDRFHVTMIRDGAVDGRIARRRNTRLFRWLPHGNTARLLTHCLAGRPDIYFYPREGVLDYAFLRARQHLRLRVAVVTHVVKCFDAPAPRAAGTLQERALEASIVNATAVFGNSRYVAETVTARFGIEAGTIHNGIDSRFFYPPINGNRPSSRTNRLTVLFAGSFQARKRPEMVIRLAARWPQVSFRMAGEGPERARCTELARVAGCSNVTFVGHLTPKDLGREMRRADVFLFPSLVEGHPQVLGQAAACGLPSVAMRVYRPEYVEDGRTGFLVDDDAGLAAALERVLKERTLRVMMAELAIEHAARFNWDDAAARWADVFEAAVRQQRQTRAGVRRRQFGVRITVPREVRVRIPRIERTRNH
jgi:glycosyltransferase involved in cell wall biosynthesis